MKKLSVIIVTYNSETLIDDCLNSIFIHNDIGDELEVIIVDNQSMNVDHMFSRIEQKYGNKVFLVKNNRNGGYGQGNNVGIKVSNAPIIMIMNPDVRLTAPIFKNANLHFLNPKVVMLGMQQMLSVNKKGLSFTYYHLSYCPLVNIFLNKLCNLLQVYNQKSMYFAGASFFIRKDILKEIGLFDENIFLYYEEQDLHLRLMRYKKSLKLVYDRNMKYIHLVEKRPLTVKPYYQIIQTGLLMCDKYRMDKQKYIHNKIKSEKTWMLIEKMRGNKSKYLFHKQLLDYLIEINDTLRQNSNLNFTK